MEEEENTDILFHEMGLDDRILKTIAKLGWETPTLIQQQAIPFVLEGKDVLMRARTGSGKTGAFAIPLVHKVLMRKQMARVQTIGALILAPTTELCKQIHNVILDLTLKCRSEVTCLDISPKDEFAVQKSLLADRPDIIVSTPVRVLEHIRAKTLSLTDLHYLVVDEADLVFSFGYEAEIDELRQYLPRICQTIMASATLSSDILKLKKLMLNNPVTLKLEEPEMASASQLTHYHLFAEEMDKATILYTLFKLHLIRGKSIVFVNTVDKSYKLKLFMAQFAIPVCVLNSELPASIRCHSMSQFNQGLYDIIVVSDEAALNEPQMNVKASSKAARKKENVTEPQSSKRKRDKESGGSRGIDFQFVANVINFDFPLTVSSYIHRAGRTARGSNQGRVLSFVSIKEKLALANVESALKSGNDDTSLFKTYNFKLEEVESFKYRAQDAWKAVTKIAIREARLMEIKQELLNCQKLKSHFEKNPADLRILRHDKALHTVRIQPHLSDVPDYMVPASLKGIVDVTGKKKKRKAHYPRSNPHRRKYGHTNQASNDPLACMDFEKLKRQRRNK